jgi:hypothetical protein
MQTVKMGEDEARLHGVLDPGNASWSKEKAPNVVGDRLLDEDTRGL